MVFDPFNDFEDRGYLRNFGGFKDFHKVKRLEAVSVNGELETALRNLQNKEYISYSDVLETHKILFSAVYPWAGQDRSETAPDIAISKFGYDHLFSHPMDCQKAGDYALVMGNNPNILRERLGEVMGLLAYAHPFLDGNGRTIMVVYEDLCRRAHIAIDWLKTNKKDYLRALTQELEEPGKKHLDDYLKLYLIGHARNFNKTIETFHSIKGLNDIEETIKGKAQYLIPSRAAVALDPEHLSEPLSNASGVRACREEVEHLSRLVYGRSNVFENELEVIDKGSGDWERVKRQIETDPASIAPLAGKEKLFGKDYIRKDAESHLSRLGQAIENYADASRQARHEIMERHEAEQKRMGQSVELPDRDILNILNLPKERQLEALAKSPQLQKQLNDYMIKIDQSLSSAEQRAISQGNTSQLAKSLGVSENHAMAIAGTVNQVRAAHAQLTSARTLSHQQGISRSR